VPLERTKKFKEFEQTYKKKEEEAKSYLHMIATDQSVGVGDLYSVTNDVMSQFKNKSDLFEYMNHIKDHDTHIYSHSMNVSMLCYFFGFWMGFTPNAIINLSVSGLLHDIGKIKVNPEIVNKQGPLTRTEFEEMKKHTTYGYQLLENANFTYPVKMAVLMHHEKMDGKGYPLGATENQINLYAKIVAIADIYDAMTSTRSYREKLCVFNVIKDMEQNRFGELDTKCLLIFLHNIVYNFIGDRVLLSNGEEAEIIYINDRHLSMPVVKAGEQYIDLAMNDDITITKML